MALLYHPRFDFGAKTISSGNGKPILHLDKNIVDANACRLIVWLGVTLEVVKHLQKAHGLLPLVCFAGFVVVPRCQFWGLAVTRVKVYALQAAYGDKVNVIFFKSD